MPISPRIIFLGTPEFAVEPLDQLVKKGYKILAVITAPDKPAGRGKKLTAPPVKKYAEKHNIQIFQPLKLKDEKFLGKVKELKPDIQVVVAFRMMPKELWSIPEKGTFNLHASLLPQYRGAAPINWAIINGEKETGLTTFFIDEKIDTGEIIFQEKLEIGNNETAGELHDRMMVKGSELVLKTVRGIANDSVEPQPQPVLPQNKELKKAPKIFKEDCRIDWTEHAGKIHNRIRGLSPYPAAFSFMENEKNEKIQMKIFASGYSLTSHNELSGTIISDGKTNIRIAVPDGYLEILNLQLAGKKAMDASDFLRGFQEITRWRMI